MVRPVVKSNHRSTEMEIKALKLSSDMKESVRAPTIWEKPSNSRMYDYHYEIAGMYYQPMIKYCIARERGLGRQVVDLPDRLQSNYDKRSYRMKSTNPDYEQFLVQLYQKRLKGNNAKFSHCAHESARRSKETSELGVVRDSGSMRDKYLTQLQLMYTEKLAKKGCIKGGVVQKTGEELLEEEVDPAASEMERKFGNKMLSRQKKDSRYGPSFERIFVLDSERYNLGEDVDFLEGCYNKAKISEALVEENVGCEVTEDLVAVEKKSFVKDYMGADNMSDFLAIFAKEKVTNADTVDKPATFIHRDTTLSKAAHDVKDRVKNAGKTILPQKPSMYDMNFNYRGHQVEKIGNHERAFVRSTMFRNPALPDFDVGYDTV